MDYEKIKINRHRRGGGNLSFLPQGVSYWDILSLIVILEIAYSGTLMTSAVFLPHPTSQRHDALTLVKGFLPQGGSHKDLLSLFKTFTTAYSGTLKISAGFTLAEVLITLGIIGVVAAMTMPTLMANQRKKEVETKLAKFYSVTNQAVKLAANEYGDISELGPLSKCIDGSGTNCSTDGAIEAFKGYFGKYLQYSKIEPNSTDTGFLVYFNDGTLLSVQNYISDMSFYINSKFLGKPKSGVNTFLFRFAPNDLRVTNKYHIGKGIEPYTYYWDGTPEDLKVGALGGANYGCDGTVASYCAKLIQMNGWKIPKDYPFKF